MNSAPEWPDLFAVISCRCLDLVIGYSTCYRQNDYHQK